ncbi:unnamed protein product, partial [Allacma fusca]
MDINNPIFLTCFVCGIDHTPRFMRRVRYESTEYKELAHQHRVDAHHEERDMLPDERVFTNCDTRIKQSNAAKARGAGTFCVVPTSHNACFLCLDGEELTEVSRDGRINIFIETGLFVQPRTKC